MCYTFYMATLHPRAPEQLPADFAQPQAESTPQERADVSWVESESVSDTRESVNDPESSPAEEAAIPIATLAPSAPTTGARKEVMLSQIENILQDGVLESYLAMGPQEQQVFRTRGEQVAAEIRVMFGKGKVKMKRIWELIRGWLRLIPGVSSFFVEQEAKIKTDQLLLLAQHKKA